MATPGREECIGMFDNLLRYDQHPGAKYSRKEYGSRQGNLLPVLHHLRKKLIELGLWQRLQRRSIGDDADASETRMTATQEDFWTYVIICSHISVDLMVRHLGLSQVCSARSICFMGIHATPCHNINVASESRKNPAADRHTWASTNGFYSTQVMMVERYRCDCLIVLCQKEFVDGHPDGCAGEASGGCGDRKERRMVEG
ncbi:hypothetical protein EJ03DRAFT_7783 [Teratosphaeria nubilosa]|uniref:Uncharacterized protein n=1 Tax=Teratosphaeria nubilosa TaxID=161662 RepID=A0A6G1LQS2_9PEZI|nr:hypothetical protein EJ03DRAFT_7783 [Teratosphaeria nubilosa]